MNRNHKHESFIIGWEVKLGSKLGDGSGLDVSVLENLEKGVVGYKGSILEPDCRIQRLTPANP